MRAAILLARARAARPDTLTADQVLRMATLDGAAAIGLGERIGSLTESKRADLTVLNYEIVDAHPVETWWEISVDFRASARVAAPNAPESRVATVTPICTADRNLLGSCASFAARWPRLPRCRIGRD